jgi:hypothetical protein
MRGYHLKAQVLRDARVAVSFGSPVKRASINSEACPYRSGLRIICNRQFGSGLILPLDSGPERKCA